MVGIIALVIVAVLVVGGVLAWRWKHGLHLFPDGSNEVGGLMPIGTTSYALDIVDDGPRSFDIDSATPNVVTDTAGATLRVGICRANGVTLIGGAVPNHPYCDHLRPFTPGAYRFGGPGPGTIFLVEITPERPGRVVLNGLDLGYHQGIRSGEQAVGLRLSFRAVRHLP